VKSTQPTCKENRHLRPTAVATDRAPRGGRSGDFEWPDAEAIARGGGQIALEAGGPTRVKLPRAYPLGSYAHGRAKRNILTQLPFAAGYRAAAAARRERGWVRNADRGVPHEG